MQRRGQAGFTMLEMIIVIALVGVIAAIALPALMDSKRKISSSSEVQAFFAELRVREEQFFAENGRYLSTGPSESATFPSTPSTVGQTLDHATMPATWKQLRVRLPETDAVRCAYVAIAGTKAAAATSGQATAMGFVSPARHWYYLLARCNADADTATDAFFMTSSEDAEIATRDVDR